jgi:curved DNA-binding protein CbpA
MTTSLNPSHILDICIYLCISQWHPDKNPGNDEATNNFQKISEAYDALSDAKKRRIYDQYGAEGVSQADQMGEDTPFHGHGHGHGHGSPFGGGGQHHMSPDDAERIFSQFFGHSDPFGGMGGPHMSRGGPRGSARRSQQQQQDPFMMFGGMPGMGGSMGGMPGGGMNRPRQRVEKKYDAIPNGTVVSLKGLVSKPEMNGDRGEVSSYDRQSGRYTVVIEDTEEQLSVKPSNLLQHVHVHVHGLESSPSLNGLKGTILAWSEDKERYNVYIMDLSKVISIKPANIILDNGTVGMITGVMAKPELNGKYGTIKSWVRESNRYDIQLTESQIIRIKVENIRV